MNSKDLSVRFACPQCDRPLKCPARSRGEQRRCPHCEHPFAVPTQSQLPEVLPSVSLPPVIPVVIAAPPLAKKEKGDVPFKFTLPNNMGGVDATVSRGTANSLVKVIVGGFLVVLGVLVSAMIPGRRPSA